MDHSYNLRNRNTGAVPKQTLENEVRAKSPRRRQHSEPVTPINVPGRRSAKNMLNQYDKSASEGNSRQHFANFPPRNAETPRSHLSPGAQAQHRQENINKNRERYSVPLFKNNNNYLLTEPSFNHPATRSLFMRSNPVEINYNLPPDNFRLDFLQNKNIGFNLVNNMPEKN